MPVKNKIGLEAEFFLLDDKNNLVIASEVFFPHDDFKLLGEIRGLPGETPEEAISLFFKEYYSLLYLAERKNLRIIFPGFVEIDNKFFRKIKKLSRKKEDGKEENIYGVDLDSVLDLVVKENKVVGRRISNGLHIHFSSNDTVEREIIAPKYKLISLPISQKIGDINFPAQSINVYTKEGYDTTETIKVSCSKISYPVIEYFVERLDNEFLSLANLGLPELKYRQPGFYERKEYGFEYRSLPFNEYTLNHIAQITKFSFDLLKGL